MDETPVNAGGDISYGTSTEIRGGRIGFVAAAGYSNTWRTRDALQQTSLDPGIAGTPQTSFRTVTTDNRIVVNALLGLGAEFGAHRIRWTNLFIRDTLKQGRLASGFNRNVADQDPTLPDSIIEQNTYWFERQLLDTQLVGEFRFGNFSVDLRGTFASTQRESPYERNISYFYLGDDNPATVSQTDVDDYVNNLSSGGQFANVAFSALREDVYAGSADIAYAFEGGVPVTLSAGYAYTRVDRDSERFQFQYFSPSGPLPVTVAQERPDFLLSDFNVYTYNIQLRDVSGAEGAASYAAGLRIHAGYGQAEIEVVDGLRAQAGVRYEEAVQTVTPIGGALLAPTRIANDYFLPAATVTWRFTPGHAIPPARLDDHRPAPVPRACPAGLPGFRIRPRVHRQPVPDRFASCSISRAATNGISRATRGSLWPASTSASTIRSRRPPSSPAAASCAPASPTRRGPSCTAASSRSRPMCPLARPRRRLLGTRRLLVHRQLHLYQVAASASTTA